MKKRTNMKRVALFGAAPDTPNMGVSALFMSTVIGLSRYINNLEFVVFDNGLGCRKDELELSGGVKIKLVRFGARGGKRYYRAENLFTMLICSKLGWLGSKLNYGIKLIDTCDAVLDISGGDSFSDIYGRERFNNINRPKQIAINRKKFLILLPQTYGPYNDNNVIDKAKNSVRNANVSWARDEDSYNNLKKLLGENFSSKTHHCGVDMAFGLEPLNPNELISDHINEWINNKDRDIPLVGINVSGLIYNDIEKSITSYGFKANYKHLVNNFVQWLLENTRSRIILISHVMDVVGHFESDFQACNDILSSVKGKYRDRVIVSPAVLNESQVKWLISKMNWFCGTRMHSTIAGLSSLVPTASISYSDKTKGVFETCGQGNHVIDPRMVDTNEATSLLINSFNQYKITFKTLPQYMHEVIKTLDYQMQRISIDLR